MILALTMIVTMTVSGCGPRNVVVPTIISGTIKPVALIAQAIAGTALQVQVLAGDDGTPLQNARELVSKSAVVFQTGASIDTWSSGMEQGSVRFVSLSAALDKGMPVSYTHLRAHETRHDLVCRLLLEKKKKKKT